MASEMFDLSNCSFTAGLESPPNKTIASSLRFMSLKMKLKLKAIWLKFLAFGLLKVFSIFDLSYQNVN